VTCCTESESADRPKDETSRTTGQEEHRDQQGLRTVRAKTLRQHSTDHGKSNNVRIITYRVSRGSFTEIQGYQKGCAPDDYNTETYNLLLGSRPPGPGGH
jgi:hypothetical protein